MRVPWEPGRTVEIATERYNLQPVLAPGEVEYLTRDLIADFDKVPENDPAAIALYRQTMLDFCRDWRALWHRFGIHQPGWPHYARLVASTARALPDLDPPLVLENRTGLAKAAFAARVLNVAVSREIYADFIGLPPGAGPRLAGPGAVPAAPPSAPDAACAETKWLLTAIYSPYLIMPLLMLWRAASRDEYFVAAPAAGGAEEGGANKKKTK